MVNLLNSIVSKTTIIQHDLTKVKLKDIKFDEANPNIMTDVEQQSLKTSLKKLGLDEFPIIMRHELDKKGKIIKKFVNKVANGEHRLREIMEDGQTDVKAVYRDMTEQERRLIRQVHNKLGGQHDAVLDKKELQLLKKWGSFPDLSELIATPLTDLEFQIRDGTRFSVNDQDPNPLKASEQTYLEGNIKQIVLFFDNKGYQKIMAKIEKLEAELKIDNHTDLFLRIFDEWYKQHENNTGNKKKNKSK